MINLVVLTLLMVQTGQATIPQDPMTPNQAWEYEQGVRRKAGLVIEDEKSAKTQIQSAINELKKLIDFTKKPEIESIKDTLGGPLFVYQRNDINRQLIEAYARIGEPTEVVKHMKELRIALEGPQGPPNRRLMFGFYGQSIASSGNVRRLLPNGEIEAEIREYRRRDPERILRGVPFTTNEATTVSEKDRVAAISYIWSEAKYNFANFDLVPDLDWDSEYVTTLELARKAKNRYAFYNVVRSFLAKLQDSHTDVGLPQSLQSTMELRPNIRTMLIESKVLVTAKPPAEAASAPLEVGDIIEKIDGIDAVEYGKSRWGNLVSCSTPQDRQVRIYTYMLLRGPKAKDVILTVRSKDDSVKQVRAFRRSNISSPRRPYEFSILPSGVAYFAFNTCSTDAPAEAFRKYLPEIKKAGKLIIDVRKNDGGSSSVGTDIISQFISKEVPDTTWETPQYRASYRPWGQEQNPFKGEVEMVKPIKDPFLGPIVVISGPITFSAGEDFLAVLHGTNRVKIVGEPTGGSTGQPLGIRLPGGGSARICTKRDRFADGTEFVGKGIMPDFLVKTTISSIQNNKDPQLDKALQILSDSDH